MLNINLHAKYVIAKYVISHGSHEVHTELSNEY